MLQPVRHFYLMLDGRKSEARERVTAPEEYKYTKWLTESVPERHDAISSRKHS